MGTLRFAKPELSQFDPDLAIQSRCGGIGRHWRFKPSRPSGHAGSTPASDTNLNVHVGNLVKPSDLGSEDFAGSTPAMHTNLT